MCALALLALTPVALVGCGSSDAADHGDDAHTEAPASGAAGAPADELRLLGKSFAYEPAAITVKAGDTRTVVLKARDLPHDITVKELDIHIHANGGRTVKKAVTFDKPGTYTFYCSVAGHRQAGMEGTLVVQ